MSASAITRLWQRLQSAIGRGRTTGIVDDSGPIQLLQVKLGPKQTRDKLMRVVEFGFSSNPPKDTDVITLAISGDRTRAFIIGTNHQTSRPRNLQPGEAAIYDDQGKSVWLKRDLVHIDAGGKDVVIENAANITAKATTKITLDAPIVECTGDLQVGGSTGIAVGSGDVVAGAIHLKTHHHSGVTAGGANTGAPV